MTRHQDSIKARLAPKLRLLAVSPTVSEIKLNQSDLSRLRAVECRATAPQLPPSLWHFLTVQEVRARALAQDRIIDLVATVVHHGRWERQACSRALQYGVAGSPTFLTGQYWVRLWLEVRDHTSAAGLQVKASRLFRVIAFPPGDFRFSAKICWENGRCYNPDEIDSRISRKSASTVLVLVNPAVESSPTNLGSGSQDLGVAAVEDFANTGVIGFSGEWLFQH